MPRTLRVVIVGGGIGGLTAAHALAQHGCEVAVYEAAPELREIGAGVSLAPNAMAVLRALELEDAVAAIGWESRVRVSHHWKSDAVLSTTTRPTPGGRSRSCTIHRADFLDVLAHGLPDSVTVYLGARADGARTEGGVAVAHFVDGSEVDADVVVGADGIHSAVRTSRFGADAPRFTGKICYRSIIPINALADGEEFRDRGETHGPHGTIVLYGIRRGELINVVCHYDDETYQHESWVTECPVDEVLDRYREWSPNLRRFFAAGERWYKWALYDRDPIPRWTDERVTLLGDAAHPMLPYLGQGACQALEDAMVLARSLDAKPDDVVSALAVYEQIRRPRASRVVLAARARGVENHLVSPIAAWKRDLVIGLRRRFSGDAGGRGDGWLHGYDASSDELAPS